MADYLAPTLLGVTVATTAPQVYCPLTRSSFARYRRRACKSAVVEACCSPAQPLPFHARSWFVSTKTAVLSLKRHPRVPSSMHGLCEAMNGTAAVVYPRPFVVMMTAAVPTQATSRNRPSPDQHSMALQPRCTCSDAAGLTSSRVTRSCAREGIGEDSSTRQEQQMTMKSSR